MSTTPDALSDALVASLQAAVPADAEVLDHEPLPVKVEDIPAGGAFGVFLFEDRPAGEGITDSVGKHPRTAIFKVELRRAKAAHLLHGTRSDRRLVNQIIQADPTLGGLAMDVRVGAFRVLVHETNSTVAAGVIDVIAEYSFDPEAA